MEFKNQSSYKKSSASYDKCGNLDFYTAKQCVSVVEFGQALSPKMAIQRNLVGNIRDSIKKGVYEKNQTHGSLDLEQFQNKSIIEQQSEFANYQDNLNGTLDLALNQQIEAERIQKELEAQIKKEDTKSDVE